MVARRQPPFSQILLKEEGFCPLLTFWLSNVLCSLTLAMQTKCTRGSACTKDISELSSVLWNSVLSSPRRLNHKVVQPLKVISTSFLAFREKPSSLWTQKKRLKTFQGQRFINEKVLCKLTYVVAFKATTLYTNANQIFPYFHSTASFLACLCCFLRPWKVIHCRLLPVQVERPLLAFAASIEHINNL